MGCVSVLQWQSKRLHLFLNIKKKYVTNKHKNNNKNKCEKNMSKSLYMGQLYRMGISSIIAVKEITPVYKYEEKISI